MKMKDKFLVLLLLLSFMSCGKMLEMDSEMVKFEGDNTLDTPEDTLNSVMGIIRQMQVVADRTVLLGEIRADLMQVNDKATTDIKALAVVPMTDEANIYNQINDYYAIINNCNYYLANVDPEAQRLSKFIFKREYIAVKVYRAWTYLQLAKIYGKVPLVLNPLLSMEEAQQAMNMNPTDLQGICDYFISDLSQYVGSKDDEEMEFPQYGSVYGIDSRKLFIPLRVILGEMCLWTGRYTEAARYLHDYLTKTSRPITIGISKVQWNVKNEEEFYTSAPYDNRAGLATTENDANENIFVIPMETTEFNGIKSLLGTVYNSVEYNKYYAQVSPSQAMKRISREEDYLWLFSRTSTIKDSIRAPKDNLRSALMAGDLRLWGNYGTRKVNRDETSDYSEEIQTIKKLANNFIPIYRKQYVYLLYAEALNRAGFPHSAFAVLKYGLCNEENEKRIPADELEKAGDLIDFPNSAYRITDKTIDDQKYPKNTMGIHARGCGNAECDKLYCIEKTVTSPTDTIEMVEDLIVNEMALETAFEGLRYYTLMRIAMRRGNNSYLAEPISRRDDPDGTKKDMELYEKLMNRDNWYLPIVTKAK